jgi:hypothetical protein
MIVKYPLGIVISYKKRAFTRRQHYFPQWGRLIIFYRDKRDTLHEIRLLHSFMLWNILRYLETIPLEFELMKSNKQSCMLKHDRME